jgi:hypothetical protein
MLQHLVDFMDSLSVVTLVVIVLLVEPLVALVHELGHGVAAVSRLSGEVLVRVGGTNPLVSWRWGRLEVKLSPLVVPGRFGGHCRFDAGRCSRSDTVAISLAGPAAALGFGLFLWFVASSLSLPSPMHRFAMLTAFVAAGSSLLCLIPLKLTDSRGRILPTDGAQALAALTGR